MNQIIRLAGCDLLTISPELLEQLERSEGILDRKLDPLKATASKDERLHLDEKTFRWMHNEDAMATEKLAEGIRKFNSDAQRLETMRFPKWPKTSSRRHAGIRRSRMNGSKAVLWDMDGTLINSEELHWISWRKTMANEGVIITRASSFFRHLASAMILLFPVGSAPRPVPMTKRNRIAEAKEELYRHLVRQVGIAPEPAVTNLGCIGSSSMDGSKRSPRQRRAPTLMCCWSPCQ